LVNLAFWVINSEPIQQWKISPYILMHELNSGFVSLAISFLWLKAEKIKKKRFLLMVPGIYPCGIFIWKPNSTILNPRYAPPTHHIFQHLITNFIFRFFNTLSLGSDLNYSIYLILTLPHTIQIRFVLTFALENPKP